MSSYLQFQNLSKRYGSLVALNDINLDVSRGSIIGVLGPNGAGKSTLFGCLLGLIFPTSGRIMLDGHAGCSRRREQIGYVCERVALYPHRTVWENGAFFAKLRGQTLADLERQLKRVGLYGARERKVRQLSKGMLQRLGLAIALCGEPDLLVLDEPFNGLDPAVLESFQKILREENDRGATLLISTHTIAAIEPFATHVAILLAGQLAASNSLDELRAEHDEPSLEAIYRAVARGFRLQELEEVFA